MTKNLLKWGNLLAAFAFVITTMTSNVACGWVYHQPKLPEAAKRLRKF
ncbi:cyclic lactone autoinducer peptide [Oscillospiraceae bacterium PP1C4]